MSAIFVWLAALVLGSTDRHALQAHQPIGVPRAPGAFDHLLVDAALRRLLIAHTSSKALAIVDLRNGSVARQIYLAGAPHGLAVDPSDDAYVVGTSSEPQVVVINRRTLSLRRSIHMPGPVDAVALDTRRAHIFADEDNGDSIWVMDLSGRQIGIIKTPPDSDKVLYDADADRIYQNFTSINATLVIDPSSLAIVGRWSSLPARRPHGLAIDRRRGRVFVAGANGWLSVLELGSGRRLAALAVSSHVDQIALDEQRQRLYCASGDGAVSVIDVGRAMPAVIDTVPVPKGAHTIAVDPVTGDVWIAYATEQGDFIMRLSPSAQN